METKRLHISMAYTFVGDTGIDIPVDLLKGKTEEEQYDIAYAYAQNHIDEIPVAENAEYISYSDNFEREDIDFKDGPLEIQNDTDTTITEEMYKELKVAVWDNGIEAINDLLGYKHDAEECTNVTDFTDRNVDKDWHTLNRMSMVLDLMPPEEFMKFYNKYCDKEEEQELE